MNNILLGVGPTQLCDRINASKAVSFMHLCSNDTSKELVIGLEKKMNYLFGEGRYSFAFPGSGSSGMEACLRNIINDGDKVVVGVAGVFGRRIVSMAEKMGAKVICVEAENGYAVDMSEMLKIVIEERPKLACIVHIETSVGVIQHMSEKIKQMGENGTLVMLDVVASLGGVDLDLNAWGVDIAYASTQKCLSSVAGLALVSMNHRVREYISRQKKKTWYWDFESIIEHNKRGVYPYTTPIVLLYMLDECLNTICDIGKEKYFEIQRNAANRVEDFMTQSGFSVFSEKKATAPNMRVFLVPKGYDSVRIAEKLYREYGIEVATGIKEMKNKLIRIGTMGFSSNMNNISALEKAIRSVVNL